MFSLFVAYVYVQDYSLSQTTLDDVFIHFANDQSEEAGLTIASSGGRQPAPESPEATPLATLPDIVPSSSSETTAV